MAELQSCRLAIIGGGPGGYVAAIRAAQLGLEPVLVEKSKIGGVCLNWGCIPTKALLKSAEVFHMCGRLGEFGIEAGTPTFDMQAAVRRSRSISEQVIKGVEYLLKQNKIRVIAGRAHLIGPNQVAVLDPGDDPVAAIQADNVLVATGARPKSIPGIAIDGERIISSTEAMSLDGVPESMVIVGAGAVGVEFAYFFNTVGCNVTLVEMLPYILPGEDAEISKLLMRFLKKQGIEIVTSAKVTSVEVGGDRIRVILETDKGEKEYEARKVLMAVGVRPNSDGLGLEDLGVELDDAGFIKVDEYMRTSAENIYAIGDVAGAPLLAHVASAEGVLAVESMAGLSPEPHKLELMPRCVYCQPQVASVGLSEEKAAEWAKEHGATIRVGRFPFRASGKSAAVGERDGIVKIISEEKTGVILGAAIVGGEATELIAELGLAMKLGATCEQVMGTVHAHPTLAESIMEAAGDALAMAIHKPGDALGGGR
jgi:dihydrolipoamide dehydrogenase